MNSGDNCQICQNGKYSLKKARCLDCPKENIIMV